MTNKQPAYRLDCECRGAGRIQRYIGHPGRVAIFLCFKCTAENQEAENERQGRRQDGKGNTGTPWC